jgi:hypothetical protein
VLYAFGAHQQGQNDSHRCGQQLHRTGAAMDSVAHELQAAAKAPGAANVSAGPAAHMALECMRSFGQVLDTAVLASSSATSWPALAPPSAAQLSDSRT